MKTATISHAKNNLSALLDRVRAGETVLILDRKRPIARIAPLDTGAGRHEDEARLQRLERRGLLHRGSGRLAPEVLKKRRHATARASDVVEALILERRSGW